MRIFLHQLRAEQLIFWRSREAAVFVFVFPILLLLLLGSVYDGTHQGYRLADLLLVGMLGYGAAGTGFSAIAITLVIRREHAMLKRIRSTPLPASVYLGAVVASTSLVFAVQAVALYAVAMLLFDASGPDRIGSLALALAAAIAAFTGLGLGAAALVRSAEGVSAVVNVILLPMGFLSGSFGPTDRYPDFLETVGKVLPLRYAIDLVREVALGGRHVWEQGTPLLVLAAWGAVGVLVAARRFTWEPRER